MGYFCVKSARMKNVVLLIMSFYSVVTFSQSIEKTPRDMGKIIQLSGVVVSENALNRV